MCWSSTAFDPAYAALAGTHRIQRVPRNEKRGRRHSSLVKVVALPVGGSARVDVRPEDVRVDVYRDTGPGGQHRNKTESAVRLTHLPSGIVVTAVEDRSQGRNRAVAWERLRAALAARAAATAAGAENAVRREVVESGRSWTWCGWRDSVEGPGGVSGSMGRCLAGRLDGLL